MVYADVADLLFTHTPVTLFWHKYSCIKQKREEEGGAKKGKTGAKTMLQINETEREEREDIGETDGELERRKKNTSR